MNASIDEGHDVFVSFALDRQTASGDFERRARALVEALQARLTALLGRTARLFYDRDGETSELRIFSTFAGKIPAARAMLVLGSPGWIQSRWSGPEVEAFLGSHAASSLFLAEMLPLAKGEDYPFGLPDRNRFVFWRERGADAIRSLDPADDEFLPQITRLADAIAQVLIDADEQAMASEAPPPSEPSPPTDRYRIQTDDPARIDALERAPFAAVLAARIVEVRKGYATLSAEQQRAFMVHLHGPWGSGKSSMLALIQAELEKRERDGEPSLVVWFNAWKHQRLRPPWWALLNTIYEAAVRKCYVIGDKTELNAERRKLQLLWWRWRLRTDWVPILLIAALVGAITYALLHGMALGGLDEPLKIVGALLTAGAGIYTYARLMVFGSGKAAQTYADLTIDRYGPVVRLFNRLVTRIRPPLVVFVDDLDRCDSDYVVELLERIQTLFRDAPVTYVIAADRKWICSSFEKRYGDFAGSIGEPGRPLGYLFLDKMFQISAGLPRLTPQIQARYLAELLSEGEPAPTAPDPVIAAAAKRRVEGITDEAAMEQVIAETKGASVAEQRAVRAAAALQITSAESARATEHRLQKFADLLEPNPRSMKRLVNAVGLAQARGILEGRTTSPETRARWVMLMLRWPILAEFIAEEPERIRHWMRLTPPADGDTRAWARADPAADRQSPREGGGGRARRRGHADARGSRAAPDLTEGTASLQPARRTCLPTHLIDVGIPMA